MSDTTEPTSDEYDRAYRDPAVLRELYHERGMSLREIADELDCNEVTVLRWMENYDIEREKPLNDSDYPVHFRTDYYGYEEWKTVVNNEKKYVKVHRLVCVAEYGADALEGMEVHHKNEIPWDNRPENLELMEPSEHARHHASKETTPSETASTEQTPLTAYNDD